MMVEPISLTVLLLLKGALGHAAFAKMGLIVKGLTVSAHGNNALLLAKGALTAVQQYGLAQGALMVAQMLIIIGSVAAGSEAAVEAYECLKNLRDQRFGAATKHAGKACRLAKPVFQVWFPG